MIIHAIQPLLKIALQTMRGSLKICLFLIVFTFAANVAALDLDFPVQCEMGKSCFIQNYVDHDNGRGFADYQCGHLSYDNHTGTDIRVTDELAMASGVTVVAAASGYVVGVRDGEPDIAISARNKAEILGKEAGNGVVIDHGDGWQTQYSHLKNGSIRVKRGQWVNSGQSIGQIGESGNADFPHVELVVRKNGIVVDPFLPDNRSACNKISHSGGLWRSSARQSITYIETALLQLGFSEQIPTRLQAQSGLWKKSKLSRQTSQFVLWTEIMGANEGDRWHIEIIDPNGLSIVSAQGENVSNRAIAIFAAGKRLHPGKLWASGSYRGRFTLVRGGVNYLSKQVSLQIE